MIYGNIFCEDFTANQLFDYSNSRNSDGLFTPYIALRDKLLEFGIEINTPDVNSGKIASFEIHMDGRLLVEGHIDRYLIAVENPLINKFNGNLEYLKNFRRVFTWNSSVLNLPGAIKIMVPNNIIVSEFRGFLDRKIFSCLIGSNKVAPWLGPRDLYGERIRTIRWYEQNAPSYFCLFGRGWGKPSAAFMRRDKFLRRIGRLRTQLFGYKPFPSWNGEVIFKSDILSSAKFSYCYENMSDLPNYITEKIFDSFLSGCIPIYWGANNILEYIPSNCFIDRRKFENTDEVHRYLLSITPEEYLRYQMNILDFLKSEKSYLFGVESFITSISNAIAGDLSRISS
jgi:hypothetical protein